MFLDLNDDGFWAAGEPTRYTDAGGHYRFSGSAPGTHTVAVLARAFYETTTPGRTGMAYEIRGGAVTPRLVDPPLTVDLNGDGALDLISHGCSFPVSSLSISLNAGDGRSFSETESHTLASSAFCHDPIHEDLNLDGHVDIVVMTNQTIVVFLNNPSMPGSFLPLVSYPLGFDAGQVSIARLDDDLLPDFVVGSSQGRGVAGPGLAVLRNDPANPGTFLNPTILTTPPQHSEHLVAADVTGDGRTDIVTTSNANEIVVYGDGTPDLIYESPSGNSWSVAFNDPRNPGQFSPPVRTRFVQGEPSGFADLNGDGLPDPFDGLSFADSPTGDWRVALSSQTTRADAVISQIAPTAVVDFGTQFDSDRDGVSDDVEALAPNNGDGNGDGILDLNQQHIASLPSAVDGSFVTVETVSGELVDVRTRQSPSAGSPAGFTFPFGLVEYVVEGLTPGADVTVHVTFHGASNIQYVYKLGATPGEPQEHFYRFADAFTLCQPNCPALFHGNQVTMFLQDGARGDDDLQANGRIVDPMGAAF